MSSLRTIFTVVFLMAALLFPPAILAQAPPQTTHVVQAGENLFRIGLQYGFTAEELALANGIADPAQIYVGQVLIIPLPIGGGEEFNTASSSPQPSPIIVEPVPAEPAVVVAEPAPQGPVVTVVDTASSAGETIHIVQANEGLAGIARAYGVSWVDIAQANGISDPNLIYAGQKLVIPNPTLQPPADYGQPPSVADSSRYILVELSKQKVTAFQDGVAVREVLASTGLPGTPTVTGDFQIYSKLPDQTMYGPGYYLPGVPWVMYFYQGYALHGTYWHNNFGTPMSHGCVNLPTADAAWFFEFAQIGTLVRVVP
jgi:lipoprotein-anchoring transpeptidase ErfK/SrfK